MSRGVDTRAALAPAPAAAASLGERLRVRLSPRRRARWPPLRPPAGGRTRHARAGAAAGVAFAAALICVLAWPLLFSDAYFDRDWEMHLWYLWHQSLTIRANLGPSLFVHYSHSVFYPEYAFYGGTIYALAGTVSLALGDAPLQTYILSYCAGFAAAYGGWWWLARIAGLRGWRAHAPGVLFVTSGGYLTIVYGRGDWQEFMAVSAMPLLCASGLSVLRSERPHLGPALALAISGALFCGSHNMTLLWGSTFLAVVGAATIVTIPQARHELRLRGVLRVARILVPALLLSAWFLLPELSYEGHTLIGSGYRYGFRYWHDVLVRYMPLVSANRLFTLSRTSSGSSANLVFALPVLAIAWLGVCVALLLRAGTRGPWMRALAILATVGALVLIAMTHAGVILALPRPYTILQFSYRVESYALLALSGATLAALVLVQQRLASGPGATAVRTWSRVLVGALLVSAIGAAQQLSAAPGEAGRSTVLRSYVRAQPPKASEPMALEDYNDVASTAFGSPREPPSIYFPPSRVHDDRVSAVVRFAPHTLIASNVAAGPELVRVTGARIAGIMTNGNDVLEVLPTSAASPSAAKRIAVRTADSAPIVVGRALSCLGAALLAAQLLALALRPALNRARAARHRSR